MSMGGGGSWCSPLSAVDLCCLSPCRTRWWLDSVESRVAVSGTHCAGRVGVQGDFSTWARRVLFGTGMSTFALCAVSVQVLTVLSVWFLRQFPVNI